MPKRPSWFNLWVRVQHPPDSRQGYLIQAGGHPHMPLRHYQHLIDECEPYLIVRDPVLPIIDKNPLGLTIPDANIVNPTKLDSGAFVQRVKHLNDITYRPLGMYMPSWVFYDCGVIPGIAFGFAKRPNPDKPWELGAMDLPEDYDGLVPVSLMTAIPTVNRRGALVYTLCSINQVSSGAAPEGLWRLTLAACAATFGLTEILATCQWRSPRLALYAGLGPLELMTAWTPAHDNPTTCTFRVASGPNERERLLYGDPIDRGLTQRYLNADDTDAMQTLQREIENGQRIAIVGPAEIRGSETRIPLSALDEVPTPPDRDDPGFTRRYQG